MGGIFLRCLFLVFYVFNPLSLRLFLVSTIKDSMFQINNSVGLEVDPCPSSVTVPPFPCLVYVRCRGSRSSVSSAASSQKQIFQFYHLALKLVLNYNILSKQQQQQKTNKKRWRKMNAWSDAMIMQPQKYSLYYLYLLHACFCTSKRWDALILKVDVFTKRFSHKCLRHFVMLFLCLYGRP